MVHEILQNFFSDLFLHGVIHNLSTPKIGQKCVLFLPEGVRKIMILSRYTKVGRKKNVEKLIKNFHPVDNFCKKGMGFGGLKGGCGT